MTSAHFSQNCSRTPPVQKKVSFKKRILSKPPPSSTTASIVICSQLLYDAFSKMGPRIVGTTLTCYDCKCGSPSRQKKNQSRPEKSPDFLKINGVARVVRRLK